MKKIILFPCDPLNHKLIDPEFKSELTICKSIGLDYLLFDFDLFINESNQNQKVGHFEFNKQKIKQHSVCAYRGWMLKVDHYKTLYNILISNGIALINTPSQYRTAHYFPIAYPFIQSHTPVTKWISKKEWSVAKANPLKLLIKGKMNEFNNEFFIKDFAKSIKGKNNSIKHYSKNDSVNYIYSEILELVEQREHFGNFYGGIVFKEFIHLKRYEDITNEWRLFILDGKIISHNQNSNLNNAKEPNVELFSKVATKLPVTFYTMDIAELENGTWTIIEVGDAQVSGLGTNQNPIGLFNNLKARL